MKNIKIYRINGDIYNLNIETESEKEIKNEIQNKFGIPLENQILKNIGKWILIVNHNEEIITDHYNVIRKFEFDEKLKKKINNYKSNMDNVEYNDNEIEMIYKNWDEYLKFLFCE